MHEAGNTPMSEKSFRTKWEDDYSKLYKLKHNHLDCCTICTNIYALQKLAKGHQKYIQKLDDLRENHLIESNARYDTFAYERAAVLTA